MISKKAENLLHVFVDKYRKTGNTNFDNTDYIFYKNHEQLLSELHNVGLLIYDAESITGHVELTSAGTSYKF